ncbi:hypothetical protein SLEP1_g15608 [Rubroshorea leprosula]|uniref:Polygalacturonase n=1 Tax=Rubroshorea leprosula TaxID=152421 RepID=A0AAV5IN01_9ROSI|nr:hypothetical protein SLEP1_g15608 [Rubroshorea leprosula]
MDLLVALLVFCVAASFLGIGNGKSAFNVVNFGAKGDGKTDNSQAFGAAWNALCGATQAGSILQIPAGEFLLQPIAFEGPCKSSNLGIQVFGNIVAPNSIEEWKNCQTGYWISFTNVDGLVIDGEGTIDGKGSAWWGNVKKGCQRPKALHFNNCNNLRLSGLNHLNSPMSHIAINDCHVVSIFNLHITAPGTSPNTDGIDISASTQVNIHDSYIATGDDCVAINSGSSQINITSVVCGPGHGISVGSLGKDGAEETAEEVHVQHCTFQKTQNGARIKTWPGGSGFARAITFEHITLIDAGNPIIIDQNYRKDGRYHTNQASAVEISQVTYSDIQGTSADMQAITLDCSVVIGCKNILMDQINITSSLPGKTTYAYCQNAEGRSSSTTPNVPCLKN